MQKVLPAKFISLSSAWSYCDSYLFASSQPIFFHLLSLLFVLCPAPLSLSFNHLYDELVCCRVHVELFLCQSYYWHCFVYWFLCYLEFFISICLCWFLNFVLVRQIWHHRIIIYLRFYVYKTKHHFYYMLFQLIIIGLLFYFCERYRKLWSSLTFFLPDPLLDFYLQYSWLFLDYYKWH